MPVAATPPPTSLNVVVIVCTPLTGPDPLNIGLDGPALTVGTLVSLSARSTRVMRSVAATALATFAQSGVPDGGAHCR